MAVGIDVRLVYRRRGRQVRVADAVHDSWPGARAIPGRRRRDMPFTSRYLFIVSMDVRRDKEAVFNEVYDQEHVPYLMDVPGVVSVSRARRRIQARLCCTPRGRRRRIHPRRRNRHLRRPS